MKRFCEEKISLLFLSLRAVNTDQIAVFFQENRTIRAMNTDQISFQFLQIKRTVLSRWNYSGNHKITKTTVIYKLIFRNIPL